MPWGNFDISNRRGDGVCMAVTTVWLSLGKYSLNQTNPGLNYDNRLRELKDQIKIQKQYDLLCKKVDTLKADQWILGQYDLQILQNIQVKTISSVKASIHGNMGFYFLGLNSGSEKDGHATGIFHDGKDLWVLFDPNFGQRVYNSVIQFFSALCNTMATNYQDLRSSFDLYLVG